MTDEQRQILIRCAGVRDQNEAALIDQCWDAIEPGPFMQLMEDLQDAVLAGDDGACRGVLRGAADIRPHLCAALMYHQFSECLLACMADETKE